MSGFKTRQQLADEYGISRRTLYSWLKEHGIELHGKLINPKKMEIIYNKIGRPKGQQ